MGMTPRQETAGRWVGGALGLGAGAAFVVAGFVAGDVVTRPWKTDASARRFHW